MNSSNHCLNSNSNSPSATPIMEHHYLYHHRTLDVTVDIMGPPSSSAEAEEDKPHGDDDDDTQAAQYECDYDDDDDDTESWFAFPPANEEFTIVDRLRGLGMRLVDEPNENDVVYGRGGAAAKHNDNYLKLVKDLQVIWGHVPKANQPNFLHSIVQDIAQKDPSGRFLESTTAWLHRTMNELPQTEKDVDDPRKERHKVRLLQQLHQLNSNKEWWYEVNDVDRAMAKVKLALRTKESRPDVAMETEEVGVVAAAATADVVAEEQAILPPIPGVDFILGNGGNSYSNNPGNVRLRQLVRERIPGYRACSCKEKNPFIKTLIQDYQEEAYPHRRRFLEYRIDRWIEATEDRVYVRVQKMLSRQLKDTSDTAAGVDVAGPPPAPTSDRPCTSSVHATMGSASGAGDGTTFAAVAVAAAAAGVAPFFQGMEPPGPEEAVPWSADHRHTRPVPTSGFGNVALEPNPNTSHQQQDTRLPLVSNNDVMCDGGIRHGVGIHPGNDQVFELLNMYCQSMVDPDEYQLSIRVVGHVLQLGGRFLSAKKSDDGSLRHIGDGCAVRRLWVVILSASGRFYGPEDAFDGGTEGDILSLYPPVVVFIPNPDGADGAAPQATTETADATGLDPHLAFPRSTAPTLTADDEETQASPTFAATGRPVVRATTSSPGGTAARRHRRSLSLHERTQGRHDNHSTSFVQTSDARRTNLQHRRSLSGLLLTTFGLPFYSFDDSATPPSFKTGASRMSTTTGFASRQSTDNASMSTSLPESMRSTRSRPSATAVYRCSSSAEGTTRSPAEIYALSFRRGDSNSLEGCGSPMSTCTNDDAREQLHIQRIGQRLWAQTRSTTDQRHGMNTDVSAESWQPSVNSNRANPIGNLPALMEGIVATTNNAMVGDGMRTRLSSSQSLSPVQDASSYSDAFDFDVDERASSMLMYTTTNRSTAVLPSILSNDDGDSQGDGGNDADCNVSSHNDAVDGLIDIFSFSGLSPVWGDAEFDPIRSNPIQ